MKNTPGAVFQYFLSIRSQTEFELVLRGFFGSWLFQRFMQLIQLGTLNESRFLFGF